MTRENIASTKTHITHYRGLPGFAGREKEHWECIFNHRVPVDFGAYSALGGQPQQRRNNDLVANADINTDTEELT